MANPNTNPNQRLPDFKPKGMGKWDKIMMWILIFIVVLFGLGMINVHFGSKTTTAPAPKVTVTAPPKAKATATEPAAPKVYVVENTQSGYIWWLDANGSPFTAATAAKFTKGHSTYHVFILKKS